jgi:ribonuclease I
MNLGIGDIEPFSQVIKNYICLTPSHSRSYVVVLVDYEEFVQHGACTFQSNKEYNTP